jgi:hypothetical protein
MSRFGYTTASGVEIPPMIDMIDGGGPGRSGDEFQGAGILSLLANMAADPYGSVRARPGFTEADMSSRSPAAAAPVDVGFEADAEAETAEVSPRRATEEDVDMLRRINPDQYFDLLPGDLLSIGEVELLQNAPEMPMPEAPQAMGSAPDFGFDPTILELDSGIMSNMDTQPRRVTPAAPFGDAGVAFRGNRPGAAGVPSTLDAIERLRARGLSPDFSFGQFGGP